MSQINQPKQRRENLAHTPEGVSLRDNKNLPEKQVKTIKYNQIEHIIESHLIVYEREVWQTKEDLQTFPNEVTLIGQSISLIQLDEIINSLESAIGLGC